jgi:hypothetical protein
MLHDSVQPLSRTEQLEDEVDYGLDDKWLVGVVTSRSRLHE